MLKQKDSGRLTLGAQQPVRKDEKPGTSLSLTGLTANFFLFTKMHKKCITLNELIENLCKRFMTVWPVLPDLCVFAHQSKVEKVLMFRYFSIGWKKRTND